MTKFIKTALLFTAMVFIYSCSSANDCSTSGKYKIDFVTGGGFTGLENGVTINCSGLVLFWERHPNSNAVNKDSLIMKPEQLNRFDQILHNPKLFTYSHSFAGNYTATLAITKDNKTNTISFNPSEEPSDFPSILKTLIAEINSIKK